MLLGPRSKNRKGASVQVDYFSYVQEIKLCPPSQSLKYVQSLLLHWDNGNQNSGSLSSVVRDDGIEFDGTFVLPMTRLCKERKAYDIFSQELLGVLLPSPFDKDSSNPSPSGSPSKVSPDSFLTNEEDDKRI